MEQAVQQLFDNAQRIVFLTGAGVSTASGIPDFRSANGLYTKDRNAEYYLSHRYFVSDPEGFYQFCKENLYFPDAKPNIIHQKQAALTQQDRATVITQNIDNLYEEAGTKHLIDFHGNLFNVYCEKCHETVSVDEYLKSRLHQKDGGHCVLILFFTMKGLSRKTLLIPFAQCNRQIWLSLLELQ